jgi:hypothetical protein
MSLQFPSMPRFSILVLATIAYAVGAPSLAQGQSLTHGQLSIPRAARGTIDLDSGNATFKVKNWGLVLDRASNGVNPADEAFTIGIAEERFLIPAGQLKASKNGKRFRYLDKSIDRGIQQLKIVLTPAGPIKVSFKVVGADLSGLIIGDPPLCLPFAVIIGDDDGFSGVSFDRPQPYPSRLLTIPGSCKDTTEWPWA